MAKLSRDQIAMYARSAGFSGGAVDIAVAVALAESGGNPKAHNPVPPDNSYGLWQINMLGGMGPERRRKFGLSKNSDLFDPATNAKAAFAISSSGSNWGPWSTYTNGAYKKHMKGGVSQADIPFVPDPLEDLGSGLAGITAMAELMIGAGRWMSVPNNWIRVTQVILGGGLVGIGLGIMAKGAVKPVLKDAAKLMSALPSGKAMKAAAVTSAASGSDSESSTEKKTEEKK